jgi:hypothetical protein
MRRTHGSTPHAPNPQRSFDEHKHLVELVKAMTQEIARLHEENAQLLAAVNFYREALRTCNGRAPDR